MLTYYQLFRKLNLPPSLNSASKQSESVVVCQKKPLEFIALLLNMNLLSISICLALSLTPSVAAWSSKRRETILDEDGKE
jgi:hypothetical protein